MSLIFRKNDITKVEKLEKIQLNEKIAWLQERRQQDFK